MKGRKFWLMNGLIFYLSISVNTFSQKVLVPEFMPPNARFNNFPVKGGKASQTSTCVMVDHEGYLWSSTETALYRYDGSNYIEYPLTGVINTNPYGLSLNCIFEDDDGTIWCGTTVGLKMLDRVSGSFIHITTDTIVAPEPNNMIRAIYQARDGKLWIKSNRDIFSYDKHKSEVIRYMTDTAAWYPPEKIYGPEEQSYAEDSLGNKLFITNKNLRLLKQGAGELSPIQLSADESAPGGIEQAICITSDSRGTLWIGSGNGGLYRWNTSNMMAERVDLKDSKSGKPKHITLASILADRNGSIWTFGNKTFSKYDPKTGEQQTYSLNINHFSVYYGPESPFLINQAFNDTDGEIWFLCKQWGLMFRFDPVREKLSEYTVPNYIVYHAVMDKTGSFWFACVRNNLFRLVTTGFPYITLPVINSSEVQQSRKRNMVEDTRGNLWLLSNQETYLIRDFDPGEGIRSEKHRFSDGDATKGGGFTDSRGNVWFGSRSGRVVVYPPDLKSYREYKTGHVAKNNYLTYVPFINEDRSGNIWIGTSDLGLFKIAGGRGKMEHVMHFYSHPDDPQNILYDFLIDSHGVFWFLTHNAILSMEMPEMRITDHTASGDNRLKSLKSNIRVAEDNRGNVYFLNEASGIWKYNRESGAMTKVPIPGEDADFHYYDLLIDKDDRFWVAHNNGISLFNPAEGSVRMFKTPRLQFDIQSKQLRSGEIIYMDDGLLYIFFREVPGNPIIPDIRITRFLVNGKIPEGSSGNVFDSKSDGKTRLSHKQNSLRFEFAALNYMNPEENRYRYFMPGIDKDTVEVAQGAYAEYKSLPKGRYRFWVTGSNNDGVWNREGVSMNVQIMAPWYLSAAAWIIYSLSFIVLTISYIRFRTYRLLREKKRLEEQISIHTAELRLKNSQLAETDRIKTHFFTDISHEIRTPLSLILGAIDNISKEEIQDDNLGEMLALMKRNTSRLMHLVNQLLDISRLDAGKMKITLIEDDIVKYLRILVYEFLSMAESKQIKYVADLPEGKLITWFDRDKLEKIISNLLSNAFRYTPVNGTVQCIVRTGPGTNGNGRSCIEVRVIDNGEGIPDEDVSRIFDRFYRVEGHTEEGGHGAGIGLSLVHEFVSLLHGYVDVKSKPGVGSEFTVSVPLGKDHLSPDEYIVVRPTELATEKTIGQKLADNSEKVARPVTEKDKLKILLIEDNYDLRNFLIETLRDEYSILESDNGKTGLNIAFTMMPDLIVTDLIMPGLDGIKLCSILKNDERTSHIPVIMLTARASPDDKIEGLRTGADDYIIKPFYTDELRTRISNLLATREKLKQKYGKLIKSGHFEETGGSADDRFIARTLSIINENLRSYDFDIASLQEQLGMSRMHLSRKIRILTGYTPAALLRNLRLEKAAELLVRKQGNITEIANSVGMSNPSNFTKAFRTYFGVSPKDYVREKNPGYSKSI